MVEMMKRMLTTSSEQSRRSTSVMEVASGILSRTMGWMAAQAIMSAATFMTRVMISVGWKQMQMLTKESSQRGMKMVIMSTMGYLYMGILKTAYLKGLKCSCVGCRSQNSCFMRSYSDCSHSGSSRQSWVQAQSSVCTRAYFSQLTSGEKVIMAAKVSTRWFFSIVLLRQGSSILSKLNDTLLTCRTSSSAIYLRWRYTCTAFSRSYLLFSSSVSFFGTLSSNWNSATSMCSREMMSSRLRKVKGVKKVSKKLLLLSSMSKSLRMMWQMRTPVTCDSCPFSYLISALNDCIWKSLVRVVGSLMLPSLLNMTGRQFTLPRLTFFLRLLSSCFSSLGLKYSLSQRKFRSCSFSVKMKKLRRSTPLTFATRFQKLLDTNFLILNCTHAGTNSYCALFSSRISLKQSSTVYLIAPLDYFIQTTEIYKPTQISAINQTDKVV